MASQMSQTHSSFQFKPEQRANLQKAFGQPRSVKEYVRMPQEKIANTGYDPCGNYKEFISNDIIKPLTKESIYSRLNSEPNMINRNERWALETIKQCSNQEQVPKFQQYKAYHFPNRTKITIDNYREQFLKTDHIGIKFPKNHKNSSKNNNKDSFLKMKGAYGSFAETQQGWAPYKPLFTTHNTSSMKYNIITFAPTENYYGSGSKMLDTRANFKQKGVAEYSDLTRTYRPNVNKVFNEALSNNKKSFHIYNGIFSQMYDACHKNGSLSVPFQCGGMKMPTKPKEDTGENVNNKAIRATTESSFPIIG